MSFLLESRKRETIPILAQHFQSIQIREIPLLSIENVGSSMSFATIFGINIVSDGFQLPRIDRIKWHLSNAATAAASETQKRKPNYTLYRLCLRLRQNREIFHGLLRTTYDTSSASYTSTVENCRMLRGPLIHFNKYRIHSFFGIVPRIIHTHTPNTHTHTRHTSA